MHNIYEIQFGCSLTYLLITWVHGCFSESWGGWLNILYTWFSTWNVIRLPGEFLELPRVLFCTLRWDVGLCILKNCIWNRQHLLSTYCILTSTEHYGQENLQTQSSCITMSWIDKLKHTKSTQASSPSERGLVTAVLQHSGAIPGEGTGGHLVWWEQGGLPNLSADSGPLWISVSSSIKWE